MSLNQSFTLDFETEAIENRPAYPPKPVGFAVKEPGKSSKYWAFGHPSGNNCTKVQAESELKRLMSIYDGFIAHHLKFDYDVLATHFPKVKLPNIIDCDDTMILGFLDDPHSKQLGLKAMSVRYLAREPKERDDLKDWIIANVPEAARVKSKWGAYISKAPGNLVAPYACADVDMTAGICKGLYTNIIENGMRDPYERELKLIPILLENERQGIRVNLPQLEIDLPVFEKAQTRLDDWIRKYLNASPDLNVDADQQMADAFEDAGIIKDWIYTKPDKNGKGGGQRSVSKKALSEMVEDQLLLAVLEYRGSLSTFTRTFLTPWRDIARETGGWVYTTWNSTAQAEGGGTRTGRLSSSNPTNFMNIPSGERYDELNAKLTGAGLFKKLKWLPSLPRCRSYVVADDSKSCLAGADISQQEVRVLAHFEDGTLCKAYQDNPSMDVYVFAMGEILRTTGLSVSRKQTKILILSVLYGIGSTELANRLGCTMEEAKKFKGTFLNTFPEVRDLVDSIKNLFKRGEPIRTWGGRLYYCEESRLIKGVVRDFSYKGINCLIQASSADMIKESILRFHEMKKESRFLLTVHDENVINTPKKCCKQELKILKKAMLEIALDVPLIGDGYTGDSWGNVADA